MALVDDYESIRPVKKAKLYDILRQLHYDVSDWSNFKGGARNAQKNPRYCYNWSFARPGRSVAVCVWHPEIVDDGARLTHLNNLREPPRSRNPVSLHVWKRRAAEVDRNVQTAYRQRLPVRVIVLDGKRRDRWDPNSRASRVDSRLLDPAAWAVTEYDYESGDFVIVRGAKPVDPDDAPLDPEIASFPEGAPRRSFRSHRHRELRARRAKIAEVLAAHGGRLVCEVPRCGFDFRTRYGEIGAGYAHVHHKIPLASAPPRGVETKLADLAIVCPNCHAMIHKGGECRPMEGLIPSVV